MKTQEKTIESTSKGLKLAKAICIIITLLSVASFFVSIQMDGNPLVSVATGILGVIGAFITDVLIIRGNNMKGINN